MPQSFDPRPVEDYLLRLYGGDPFSRVRDASDAHRASHGPECGIYPSGPHKMRLMNTIARSAAAKRLLEIGCGLGYSALWLADAAGANGRIDAIDRFPEHIALAYGFASDFRLSDRITFIEGEGRSVLATLSGPYDFIHDDGWFGKEPDYLERMLYLLLPGGLLAISNWFLLEDAISGEPHRDWTEFAGPAWADDVKSYARRLASHPGLHVSFVMRPWLALAVKLR